MSGHESGDLDALQVWDISIIPVRVYEGRLSASVFCHELSLWCVGGALPLVKAHVRCFPLLAMAVSLMIASWPQSVFCYFRMHLDLRADKPRWGKLPEGIKRISIYTSKCQDRKSTASFSKSNELLLTPKCKYAFIDSS